MPLHNKIDKNILKSLIQNSNEQRKIISFYKYFSIENPDLFRNQLYLDLNALGVLGRVYVSTEGVNAQMSVPESQFDHFKKYITDSPYFSTCKLNEAVENMASSFWVLKVKVRQKIVADGLEDGLLLNLMNNGVHISAETFNTLTEKQDTIVVDMRNHYEYEVGHFKNAITAVSDTFREQLPKTVKLLEEHKNKNIVMYCTGGIRCEKASAYLKKNDFKNVFQLDGGIIHYHNQVKQQGLDNKFIGKNFVFDQRLGERITPDVISHCHQCGKPSDRHTNCANSACHLLFIQCEECAKKMIQCCTVECKETILLPLETQRQLRKGKKMGRNIFNKSQERLERTFQLTNHQ